MLGGGSGFCRNHGVTTNLQPSLQELGGVANILPHPPLELPELKVNRFMFMDSWMI